MTTTGQRADRTVAAALVTALALGTSACKQAEAIEQEHYQASKIEPSEHGDHPTVILTELGAEQAGVETAPVRNVSDGTTVPYSALLFDASGQPYVFVSPERLHFHREDVEVASIDGDVVTLADGPAVGTLVVVEGVPQVHGAELEFGAY